jgi:hypothetical protein
MYIAFSFTVLKAKNAMMSELFYAFRISTALSLPTFNLHHGLLFNNSSYGLHGEKILYRLLKLNLCMPVITCISVLRLI